MLLPQKSQHDFLKLVLLLLLLLVLLCLDFSTVFVLKPAFAFEAEQQINEAPEGEPWDALCAGVRGR